MDWQIIAAFSGAVSILAGAGIKLYGDSRVNEARLKDARDDLKLNYDYCHKTNHDMNGHLMNHHARLRIVEDRMKIRVDPRDE